MHVAAHYRNNAFWRTKYFMSPANKQTLRHRAAAYVRMSTDHQQYSTSNQMDFIREDAGRRGWEIVQVFSDEGKSGLNFKNRAGLKAMIAQVQAGQANYSHILVYDVSRWGRYQDPDESAHYEFICRKYGVSVHYCAEDFELEGTPIPSIAKTIKRVMAAEYSRELSQKVFDAACGMIRRGYMHGGLGVFGLRRVLVDSNGRHIAVLKLGEQKSLRTGRVILVPGPEEEVKVVRWIFECFVHQRAGALSIARMLNQRHILSPSGVPWTDIKISGLLQNEKYISNMVYGRRSCKLQGRNVPNPPDQWIRKERAFEGIVPRDLFFEAQALFKSGESKYRITEAAMLDGLRRLYEEHGHLTSDLINEADGLSRANTYSKRFGSLPAAYRHVGFIPPRNYHTEITDSLGRILREMTGLILRRIESQGGSATWIPFSRTLVVNQELRIWIIFIRHYSTSGGTSFWRKHRCNPAEFDITLAVRMNRGNDDIQDFYLLPALDSARSHFFFTSDNGIYRDAYRFQSLDFLASLAARHKLTEAG